MEGDPKIKRELRAGRSNSGADWESRINSRRTTPRVHLKNCVCPHMSGVNSGCECTLFVWLAIDTEFLVVRMAGWLRTIHKRERERERENSSSRWPVCCCSCRNVQGWTQSGPPLVRPYRQLARRQMKERKENPLEREEEEKRKEETRIARDGERSWCMSRSSLLT